MEKEYKEVALTKEGAQALVKAMSEANAKIVGGGKTTAKKATVKPKK
jgi:hypothetical protein